MSKEYDNYIAAKKNYDDTAAAVQTLIDQLAAFASPLIKNWKDCYVELYGSATPMETVSTLQRVQGNNVPNPAEIQQAMLRHRESQKLGHAAWTSLSEQERKELVHPPWLKRR